MNCQGVLRVEIATAWHTGGSQNKCALQLSWQYVDSFIICTINIYTHKHKGYSGAIGVQD